MIRINKSIVIFIFLLGFLYSCHKHVDNQLQKQVHEMLGKKIRLPRHKTLPDAYQKNIKLVTRVNGNCMPCIYKLNLWAPFIQKLESKYGVPVLFYVAISDTLLLKKTLAEIHFDHPMILDYNDDFMKDNHLSANSILHTMLLDSTNRILLVGTPLNNTTLQKLYFERIEELLYK